MSRTRYALIGLVASAVVAVIAVACGGGGGGGGDGGAVTYSVTGTLTGSTGTVVLKLNGANVKSMSADGPFTIGALASGSTYNVQIAAPNQRCTVSNNGAGTIGGANVTGVTVTCGAQTTQVVIRSTALTGAQQNPPSISTATGVGGIIVDPATKAITGGMIFPGLTPTAGGHHIHQAPSGDPTGNGPVIIGLTLASDGVTAYVPAGTVLTDPQYAALLAGELYFNVHTTNNLCPPAPDCSAGEIRGQITAQGGVLAAQTTLNKDQEVPASTSTATGQGTLLVDAATRRILVSYITHNVTNVIAQMAHIHAALGPGTNGGVIVGFNQAAGGSIATAPAAAQMTAQNVSDFLINYLYFNVHSTNNLCAPASDCSAGEIRGNIVPIP
jgi:CHRD domain-containing protein